MLQQKNCALNKNVPLTKLFVMLFLNIAFFSRCVTAIQKRNKLFSFISHHIWFCECAHVREYFFMLVCSNPALTIRK